MFTSNRRGLFLRMASRNCVGCEVAPVSHLFAKGDDPDALYGAWVEDGIPARPHDREVLPERKPWDPDPCCAAGRVVYGLCTCAYQTVCPECGEQCHGTHD